MKIRVLALLYGPTISAKAGDVVTVDDESGRSYIAAGAAVEIPDAPRAKPDEPEPPEAAVLETPERAVLPPARPRRMLSGAEPSEPQQGDKAP